MKRFKTLDKHLNEGDIPLILTVENEEYCINEANLPLSYGYVLMMLETHHDNFSGCLAFERNTIEELRDALTELLETYP